MNRKQLILVIISIIIVIVMILVSAMVRGEGDTEGVEVVVTFYPLAYLTESIGGDMVSVNALVPYNSEIHSWQPSPQDIIRSDRCDILIYNGGPIDGRIVDDILPNIDQANKMIVNSSEGVLFIAGGEDGHDHGGGGDATDPHTWLSPHNAIAQGEAIYGALVAADPDNAAYYGSRWSTLKGSLEQLDQEYVSSLANKTKDCIVVSHSAYGYLAYRYGFGQDGVIGMSADEEPTVTTIKDLVDLMVEENVTTVYVDPVYNNEYSEQLRDELESRIGQTVSILNLYLMLGPYNGMDYMDQMEQNLINLRIGLEVI